MNNSPLYKFASWIEYDFFSPIVLLLYIVCLNTLAILGLITVFNQNPALSIIIGTFHIVSSLAVISKLYLEMKNERTPYT